MWAVVLIVALAIPTLQASPDLSAHANSVANLDSLDLGTDLYRVTNDFMTDADRKGSFAPASIDRVDV